MAPCTRSWMCLSIVCLLSLAINVKNVAGSGDCLDTTYVCGSVIKSLGEARPDRQLCICNNRQSCLLTWNEQDRMGLTWEHPTNAFGMKVQYRYCAPVVPERTCSTDEEWRTVGVVGNKLGGWEPHVKELKCQCASGVYQNNEWRVADGEWLYYFTCVKKPFCRHHENANPQPCVTFSMDYYITKVTGVLHNCKCPSSHICPETPEDEWYRRELDPTTKQLHADGEDKNGYFIKGYCEPIHEK